MRVWLLVLLSALSTPTHADDLPALHDVVGVAWNDVLNIRAEPTANSGIVGTYSPDGTAIEVTALNAGGRWGRVNVSEGHGWVSMRYLRRTGPDWRDGLPSAYVCFGTEPFWSLRIDSAEGAWRGTIGTEGRVIEEWSAPVTWSGDRRIAARFVQPRGWMTGTFDRQTCSDGMSDRLYGMSVTLIGAGAGLDGAVSGCCSVVAP